MQIFVIFILYSNKFHHLLFVCLHITGCWKPARQSAMKNSTNRLIKLNCIKWERLLDSLLLVSLVGKGDLVGCDVSINLMHNGIGNVGTSNPGGQDYILKSSSDVKVGQFNSMIRNKTNEINIINLGLYSHKFSGSNLLWSEMYSHSRPNRRVKAISGVSAGIC